MVLHESQKPFEFGDNDENTGLMDGMGVQAATSGAVHPNGDKVTHPDRHIDPRGRSFKYADDVINYIRTKHNQMSEISYRFTSNDHNTTYYGHESCEYNSAFIQSATAITRLADVTLPKLMQRGVTGCNASTRVGLLGALTVGRTAEIR